MKGTEEKEANPEKEAKKPIYYIQKEGEYTFSFYPDKMLYSNISTGKSEEIPYESIREIDIKKKFSFSVLIKYFGIFFIGIALGAIAIAEITGSYSNSYVLPCLSSSTVLFILGILMLFTPIDTLSLEIYANRRFIIRFPERDRAVIEDIVYLVRNRTLSGLIKKHESKELTIEKSKMRLFEARKKSPSSDVGIQRIPELLDNGSAVEEHSQLTVPQGLLQGTMVPFPSLPHPPLDEKLKFEIEGKKGHKLIFTEKNIFYIKEITKRIEYKDIKEIKFLYKKTEDRIATIILLMFGIAGIVVVSVVSVLYNYEYTVCAAGCLIVPILSFIFGIVYAWRILTKSIIQIETSAENIRFFSKKANEEKMEEAVRYAEIMRNKAFLEKMNEIA